MGLIRSTPRSEMQLFYSVRQSSCRPQMLPMEVASLGYHRYISYKSAQRAVASGCVRAYRTHVQFKKSKTDVTNSSISMRMPTCLSGQLKQGQRVACRCFEEWASHHKLL